MLNSNIWSFYVYKLKQAQPSESSNKQKSFLKKICVCVCMKELFILLTSSWDIVFQLQQHETGAKIQKKVESWF